MKSIPERRAAGAVRDEPACEQSAPNPYQWDPLILFLGSMSCVLIIAGKFILVPRLNINWDEFHFLSDIYVLARGQLTNTFQGAYTHLFQWLTLLRTDEIGQVIVGRATMLACLCVTCVLIWKLASTWVSRSAAAVAPLCYLAMLPVAKHGASFRYDPILATLSVAILLLVARPQPSHRRLLGTGVCFGVAVALTSKVVLLIPALLALLILNSSRLPNPWRSVFAAIVRIAIVAAATSVALLALHRLWVIPAESTLDFAVRSVQTTLLDTPLLPQLSTFYQTLRADALAWTLLGTGVLACLTRSVYRPAIACSLALLPILFYRNSFSYYYIVMLAPACVLASVGVEAIREALAPMTRPVAVFALTSAVVLALSAQGLLHLYYLRHDDIERQQAVVDAVHAIFPSPVPYIDHSGAISSFQKANFFMSSWGLERYRARGKSFMLEAIDKHRPALLVANTPILDPEHPWSELLLPIDRELIQRFYIPYWGPIRVAGAQIEIQPGIATSVSVPFSGTYRLEADGTILVDGTPRGNGDSIDITNPTTTVVLATMPNAAGIATVRLVWGSSHPAPTSMPPFRVFYTGL